MHALVYEEYGAPDVLEHREVPRPTPSDDQVLVEVKAASINPYDWHFVRGLPYLVRPQIGLRRPKHPIPGADVAGVIAEVGRNVTAFAPGDAVIGAAAGTFAEYVPAKPDNLVAKPDGVSFVDAAALPMAGYTALQALRQAGVGAGDRVLVNGASGGVGTYAVQLAAVMGAEVTGVCSTRNVELVHALGATHVIDYTASDYTTSKDAYDVIVDNVRTHTMADNRRALTEGGRYVLVGALEIGDWVGALSMFFGPRIASIGRKQTMSTLMAKHNTDDLSELAAMAASGDIRAVVDRTYPLASGAEALAYVEDGHARGKVVLITGPGDDA